MQGARTDLMSAKELGQFKNRRTKRKRKYYNKYYTVNRKRILEDYAKRRATVRGKHQQKAALLKLYYGLSLKEFFKMRRKQKSRCAICLRKPKRLSVDHNHANDKVRALLCQPCNLMLGAGQDQAKVLQKGANYLIYWRKRHGQCSS